MIEGILVTGASSGIGYATAQLLAREGYQVYAGVRTQSDALRLRSEHASIFPVTLDVRIGGEIAQAIAAIERGGANLIAVVNNAGVAVAGPLEYLPLDEFRRQFEINVFGALAVTQAALPLLRKTRGRVVFISSVSGQIAPPFVGAYAASKFALEALADSLRMELAPFGIAVCVVQPGSVRTPIWQKGRDAKAQMQSRMPARARDYYGEAIEHIVRATEREERTGIAPGVVARAVLEALRAAKPRARYAVGSPPGWQRRMATLLPERWRDRLIVRSLGT